MVWSAPIGVVFTEGPAASGLLYGGGSARWVTSPGRPVAIALVRRGHPDRRPGVKYTIGLRIDEEDEVEGIDFVEHGESAYDLHTGGGVGGERRPRRRTAPATQGANA